jgi:hypothetical protein
MHVLTVWSNFDHLVKVRFWEDVIKNINFHNYLPS